MFWCQVPDPTPVPVPPQNHSSPRHIGPLSSPPSITRRQIPKRAGPALPDLLVSALRLRAPTRPFAGRRAGPDPKFLRQPAGEKIPGTRRSGAWQVPDLSALFPGELPQQRVGSRLRAEARRRPTNDFLGRTGSGGTLPERAGGGVDAGARFREALGGNPTGIGAQENAVGIPRERQSGAFRGDQASSVERGTRDELFPTGGSTQHDRRGREGNGSPAPPSLPRPATRGNRPYRRDAVRGR